MIPERLDWLLPLYHRLPPRAQSWAASWQGRRLGRWRYGAETERLVDEALARESWPAERWRIWSEARLAEMLDHAARTVPFYRDAWARRRRDGDASSWERLENWPVLENKTVRAHPEAFRSEAVPRGQCHLEATSGTTGNPLEFLEDRESNRAWYALAEARWRRRYGVSRHDRWAMLGGRLVVRRDQLRPPFWVWNAGLNQLYVSPLHLAPQFVPSILDALERHEVVCITGYTSCIHAVAREARRLGRRLPLLRVVVAEAEPLYDFQREAIAAAFGCPVRETYGMCEHVGAASERECGRLHLWPEAGYAEVFDGQRPVEPGVTGELVFSGLLNRATPLIRYRQGDRGQLVAPAEPRCPCGSTLPRLESVDGRMADVVYGQDGRPCSLVDNIFTPDLPILEGQIVQRADTEVVVRVVPDGPAFDEHVERQLCGAMRDRLGNVRVSVERLSRIPRNRNGKFSVVISEIAEVPWRTARA